MSASMFDLNSSELLLVLFCAMMIGFSKAGLRGAGILAVPIFADVFPAMLSAGILLPLLCVGDGLAVLYYRKHAKWELLWPLFPWVVIGIVIATYLADILRNEPFKIWIGMIVLIMLALNIWTEKKGYQGLSSSKTLCGVTGIFAGVTTMLANAAGPVMAIYFFFMKLPKREFMGTGAWYFFLVNMFKLPFMFYLGSVNHHSLYFNLKLIPMILIGAWLGIKCMKYLPELLFKRVVQGLTFLAALRLCFS